MIESATATLSANNSSIEELTAAFEAPGIKSAVELAHEEVEEYRPNSVEDTEFPKLRCDLAKFISAAVDPPLNGGNAEGERPGC